MYKHSLPIFTLYMYVHLGESHGLVEFSGVAQAIREAGEENVQSLHDLGDSCIQTEKEI